MRSRTLGNLCGLSAAILLAYGCAAAPPPAAPPPPPPPPPAPATTCTATAVIVHWIADGKHKAEIRGNAVDPSEAKTVVLDRSDLTPRVSRICWQFVSLDEPKVAEIDSIEIIQVSSQMLKPPLNFDPKTTRVFGAVYWTPPASGSIVYPRGSGHTIQGARWEYKAKLKLSAGPIVDIDPDFVIKG